MAVLTVSKTPLTDYLSGIGLVAGSGAVLGAMGGFIVAAILRPMDGVEVSLGGILNFEVFGIPKPDYGAAIAVCGAVGSIAILLLRVAEYYGAI